MPRSASIWLLDLMLRAYGLMTLGYPRPFRDRFGREMRLAFKSEALTISKTSGNQALIGLAMRVLADWMITMWKEHEIMRKYLLASILGLSFLMIDWITFHDWREPHTVRDYLTLAASLLLFAYLGLDLVDARRNPRPTAR